MPEPCPWCGAAARTEWHTETGMEGKRIWFIHTDCDHKCEYNRDPYDCGGPAVYFATERECIERWNLYAAEMGKAVAKAVNCRKMVE